MDLTDEARSLLRRIHAMGSADVDPVVTNISLAGATEWTPDEVTEILEPYDELCVRAVSRFDDLRPDEPSGVRYQLTEEGRRLFET
jgi:hypothetical protein